MNFWQYTFSFLFTRHPVTGVRYLSKQRLYVFLAGISLVLVALTIIAILGAPIEYTNQPPRL